MCVCGRMKAQLTELEKKWQKKFAILQRRYHELLSSICVAAVAYVEVHNISTKYEFKC